MVGSLPHPSQPIPGTLWKLSATYFNEAWSTPEPYGCVNPKAIQVGKINHASAKYWTWPTVMVDMCTMHSATAAIYTPNMSKEKNPLSSCYSTCPWHINVRKNNYKTIINNSYRQREVNKPTCQHTSATAVVAEAHTGLQNEATKWRRRDWNQVTQHSQQQTGCGHAQVPDQMTENKQWWSVRSEC